jgi:methyl-accepting chemotaxis protein
MVDRTKENLDGAIATTIGWVHAKTGELLVSIRGLSGAVEWSREMIAELKAVPEAIAETVAEIKEDIAEVKADYAEMKKDVAETVTDVKTVVEKVTKKATKKTTKKISEPKAE